MPFQIKATRKTAQAALDTCQSTLIGFGGTIEFTTRRAAQKFIDALDDARSLPGVALSIEEVRKVKRKKKK